MEALPRRKRGRVTLNATICPTISASGGPQTAVADTTARVAHAAALRELGRHRERHEPRSDRRRGPRVGREAAHVVRQGVSEARVRQITAAQSTLAVPIHPRLHAPLRHRQSALLGD